MKTSVSVIVIIIALVAIGFAVFYKTPESKTVSIGAEKNINSSVRLNTTTKSMKATFNTNQGVIKLELYGDKTPKTVENFTKLAKEGFYNGTKFHRVIEDFMIQGGDPLTKDNSKQSMWGTGGPGYTFEDEFVSELSNVTGTISMANAGPGTNGSQFFINTADNTFLNGKHTVFGEVISGMDIVIAISKSAKNERDVPNEEVIIESIEIAE